IADGQHGYRTGSDRGQDREAATESAEGAGRAEGSLARRSPRRNLPARPRRQSAVREGDAEANQGTEADLWPQSLGGGQPSAEGDRRCQIVDRMTISSKPSAP